MSTSADPAIETHGLTKVFKSTTAVDGLDLAVGRAEIFGLVGPDGAGKTTTIRLLSAIMDPTSGSASVLGYDTRTDPEPIKARTGYMAQRFNLYGDLSVWENLEFFARAYLVPDSVKRERMERLLAFARLGQFRERRAAHLSGGMQKKLALACTLIHTPDLILLDEPTTGVDPVSRREFWDILSELHVQGITLVVSTPYMDEAERCTRVGLMHRGRLIACDTPERIIATTVGDLLALRASDLRATREVVSALDGVLETQTYGDQLRLFVNDADRVGPAIRSALASSGLDLLSMERTRPRMEEAFISVIGRQREQESAADVEVRS